MLFGTPSTFDYLIPRLQGIAIGAGSRGTPAAGGDESTDLTSEALPDLLDVDAGVGIPPDDGLRASSSLPNLLSSEFDPVASTAGTSANASHFVSTPATRPIGGANTAAVAAQATGPLPIEVLYTELSINELVVPPGNLWQLRRVVGFDVAQPLRVPRVDLDPFANTTVAGWLADGLASDPYVRAQLFVWFHRIVRSFDPGMVHDAVVKTVREMFAPAAPAVCEPGWCIHSKPEAPCLCCICAKIELVQAVYACYGAQVVSDSSIADVPELAEWRKQLPPDAANASAASAVYAFPMVDMAQLERANGIAFRLKPPTSKNAKAEILQFRLIASLLLSDIPTPMGWERKDVVANVFAASAKQRADYAEKQKVDSKVYVLREICRRPHDDTETCVHLWRMLAIMPVNFVPKARASKMATSPFCLLLSGDNKNAVRFHVGLLFALFGTQTEQPTLLDNLCSARMHESLPILHPDSMHSYMRNLQRCADFFGVANLRGAGVAWIASLADAAMMHVLRTSGLVQDTHVVGLLGDNSMAVTLARYTHYRLELDSGTLVARRYVVHGGTVQKQYQGVAAEIVRIGRGNDLVRAMMAVDDDEPRAVSVIACECILTAERYYSIDANQHAHDILEALVCWAESRGLVPGPHGWNIPVLFGQLRKCPALARNTQDVYFGDLCVLLVCIRAVVQVTAMLAPYGYAFDRDANAVLDTMEIACTAVPAGVRGLYGAQQSDGLVAAMRVYRQRISDIVARDMRTFKDGRPPCADIKYSDRSVDLPILPDDTGLPPLLESSAAGMIPEPTAHASLEEHRETHPSEERLLGSARSLRSDSLLGAIEDVLNSPDIKRVRSASGAPPAVRTSSAYATPALMIDASTFLTPVQTRSAAVQFPSGHVTPVRMADAAAQTIASPPPPPPRPRSRPVLVHVPSTSAAASTGASPLETTTPVHFDSIAGATVLYTETEFTRDFASGIFRRNVQLVDPDGFFMSVSSWAQQLPPAIPTELHTYATGSGVREQAQYINMVEQLLDKAADSKDASDLVREDVRLYFPDKSAVYGHELRLYLLRSFRSFNPHQQAAANRIQTRYSRLAMAALDKSDISGAMIRHAFHLTDQDLDSFKNHHNPAAFLKNKSTVQLRGTSLNAVQVHALAQYDSLYSFPTPPPFDPRQNLSFLAEIWNFLNKKAGFEPIDFLFVLYLVNESDFAMHERLGCSLFPAKKKTLLTQENLRGLMVAALLVTDVFFHDHNPGYTATSPEGAVLRTKSGDPIVLSLPHYLAAMIPALQQVGAQRMVQMRDAMLKLLDHRILPSDYLSFYGGEIKGVSSLQVSDKPRGGWGAAAVYRAMTGKSVSLAAAAAATHAGMKRKSMDQ